MYSLCLCINKKTDMKLFNLIVFFLSMIFLSGCTTDKTDNKQTDW